jgi:hypothetical protein
MTKNLKTIVITDNVILNEMSASDGNEPTEIINISQDEAHKRIMNVRNKYGKFQPLFIGLNSNEFRFLITGLSQCDMAIKIKNKIIFLHSDKVENDDDIFTLSAQNNEHSYFILFRKQRNLFGVINQNYTENNHSNRLRLLSLATNLDKKLFKIMKDHEVVGVDWFPDSNEPNDITSAYLIVNNS